MKRHAVLGLIAGLTGLLIAGCAKAPIVDLPEPDVAEYEYVIGPGDGLTIFVWRNPEVTTGVTVRPDGKINTPLVEDLIATGKTPSELAREVEEVLSKYIKDPLVTILVGGFVGPYDQQVRIVGEASEPQGIPYRAHMTLLDVMIAVGGLTEFADGNKATITRFVDGESLQTRVRLEDLIRDGDLSANMKVMPGDILMIPEAWF